MHTDMISQQETTLKLPTMTVKYLGQFNYFAFVVDNIMEES